MLVRFLQIKQIILAENDSLFLGDIEGHNGLIVDYVCVIQFPADPPYLPE